MYPSIETMSIRPAVATALLFIETELRFGEQQGNSIAIAALQTLSELVESIRRAPARPNA